MLGEIVTEVYNGAVDRGSKNFFIDAATYAAGVYQVVVITGDYKLYQKLIVQ